MVFYMGYFFGANNHMSVLCFASRYSAYLCFGCQRRRHNSRKKTVGLLRDCQSFTVKFVLNDKRVSAESYSLIVRNVKTVSRQTDTWLAGS